MSDQSKTYQEFWTLYVSEHSHPLNRRLHFVGTTLALLCALPAYFFSPYFLLVAPVIGYGFAWVGHFLVEGNKPASFRHPLWSFRADFQMYVYLWMRKMEKEVEKQTRR